MANRTPDNEHPSSFYQAFLDEATARLVALVRSDRPQLLVTYDERRLLRPSGSHQGALVARNN
jgi:hypothetical protein